MPAASRLPTPRRWRSWAFAALLSALGPGGALPSAKASAPAKTGPAAPAPAESAEAPAPRSCPPASATLGDPQAPVLLRVWLDPVLPEGAALAQLGYQTWLAARELQARSQGRVRVELRVVRRALGRGTDAPRGDEARDLFMRAIAASSVQSVLRTLGRRGAYELRLVLDRPERRAALAADLGLPAQALEGVDPRCMAGALDRAELELLETTHGGGVQLPAVEVLVEGHSKTLLQDADHRVQEIRTHLTSLTMPKAREPWLPTPVPPGPSPRRGTPELSRTYPGHGVLLGGPGLPHHLLIFAEDERSSILPRALRLALRLRAQIPGELSVQVVAVGSGSQAETFTRRLCAARQLGLELPYLHWLTEPEGQREELDGALIAGLDAFGEGAGCEATEIPDLASGDAIEDRVSGRGGRRRPRSLLHTRGLWLDGESISENELGRLTGRFPDAPDRAADFFGLPPERL